jgi:murein DD-endopeptidase MepM/ murein hydrolase activator NlpD
MGDLRAGSGDPVAGPGDRRVPTSTGKRVARHAAEQPLSTPYVGRRVARVEPEAVEPLAPPVQVAASAPLEPVVPLEPVLMPVEPVVPLEQVVTPQPIVLVTPEPIVLATPSASHAPGRRVAPKRGLVTRLPSAPLVMGIAILAVSAGGALQAMHPDLAGANGAHRLVAANALSGSSGVGSASLLGRSAVVSRSSDRTSDRLQAAADAQAKQRGQALSAFAAKAEKQASKIRLHQWVLPVTPGVYHLTARFGEYSYLWSSMHTGLDFAAPTGTAIMAVAGGTITDVGYSGAYGNRTVETLPDGTELWYCHQNAFGTSVGATVKPGQVIGYVGSTGNVTGPHLHLEVHPGGGDPVDPYTALIVHGLHP